MDSNTEKFCIGCKCGLTGKQKWVSLTEVGRREGVICNTCKCMFFLLQELLESEQTIASQLKLMVKAGSILKYPGGIYVQAPDSDEQARQQMTSEELLERVRNLENPRHSWDDVPSAK